MNKLGACKFEYVQRVWSHLKASPDLPSGAHLEVCAMLRYRPNRSRRVRAYVHRTHDLAALTAAVKTWLFLRGAM